MLDRAALLIHCSCEEAANIRRLALNQRRTISGCILQIVFYSIEVDNSLLAKLKAVKISERVSQPSLPPLPVRRAYHGAKTTLLLRCSAQEARRIRLAAKRRRATLGGYVMRCLRRHWEISARQAALWEAAKR